METKTNDILVYTNKYTPAEFQEIYNNNPDVAVREYICEICKTNNLTPDNVFKFYDAVVGDNDILNHIYGYMAKNLQKPPVLLDTVYPEFALSDISDILNSFKDKIKVVGEEYKRVVESICEPIDKSFKKRLFEYIESVIETLILSNNQQKQFIISQHSSNSIETYHQLQQIISLIETCEIHSKQTIEFYNLYNYLQDNEVIFEKFKQSNEVQHMEVELKLIDVFTKWYNRYIPHTNDNNNGNDSQNTSGNNNVDGVLSGGDGSGDILVDMDDNSTTVNTDNGTE
jgi:hypothetical protein